MIGDLWYKNAIVYSLDVETYLDANGDGIGDFEGLTRRLDYLEGLGVTAVWLTPFQPSPRRDDGYDIADFYGVDRRFGSGGDFVEFMREADSRGIRILMDLVVNHTSNEHPWFQERHDWYVWSKRRPANWRSGVVFPGVQKSTWTYDKKAREYYFHRFYDFQPDLDMDNPRVREEVRRIMGFWLQLGVAGFRMDAVPFVLEKPPRGKAKPQIHFEYLEQFREFLQWRVGDAVLLGEANVMPQETQPYFGGGHGLHMMFNFWVNQHLWLALATGDARPLARALRATRKLPPTAQWAHFLRNTDELDLGRLAAADRKQVFATFAPEESMQLYGRGIRRRPAPMIGDARRLQLAYSLVRRSPVEDPAMEAALAASGASIVASAVLAGGALTGKYDDAGAGGRLAARRDDPALAAARDAGRRLRALAGELDTTAAALAIAFTIAHPACASVLVGATSAGQVAENAVAADLLARLDGEQLARLRAIGA